VRGGHLVPDDPLVDEWAVAVVGPHFAAALAAVDLGDAGPERERRFDYILTYDRDRVLAVASSLMARISGVPVAGDPLT
jgi:DICT domain-containing protein